MRYLLGVDFGGGSSKATLLNENGEVVCTASAEYPMLHPEVGFAEQNPEDIWRSFVENVREILRRSQVPAQAVTAVSLDAGTHIAVLLDKEDRVIRPAIYWSDIRSAPQAARLADEHGEAIMRQAYNTSGPIWNLPQLQWIRENEPDNFGRIHRILFLKDYIRFRLTGIRATDSIDAMGSMLYDVENNCWSEWLCSLCGIDPAVLPEIVSPDTVVGNPTPQAAEETGLSPSTQIVAGATDTVMEVYAAGAVAPGQATVKIATAGRICVITDHPVPNPLLMCYRHIIPGLWYPGTGTKACAASLRWYRDVLERGAVDCGLGSTGVDYKAMDKAAARVPAGCDGLYFHPYLQGELTPYMDPGLKASFVGLSGFHTQAHCVRAVLEGVAYSLRDCLGALRGLGITIGDTARFIGGGAKSPLWRQITADVLGIPLVKALSDDSSLGSAMLAGVATGVFGSYQESVERCVRMGDTVLPRPENAAVYERGFTFYKEIHDALAPVYARMRA